MDNDNQPKSQPTPGNSTQPNQPIITSIPVMDIKPTGVPQTSNEEINPSPSVEQVMQESPTTPSPAVDSNPMPNSTLQPSLPEEPSFPQPPNPMPSSEKNYTMPKPTPLQPKSKRKGAVIIILTIIIVTALIGVAVYVYILSTKETPSNEPATTATEEKVTSDDAGNVVTEVQNEVNSQSEDKDFSTTTLSDTTLNL